MLRIRFEGMLRQIAQQDEAQLDASANQDLEAILRIVEARFPGILGSWPEYQWRYGSSDVLVALNGQILDPPDANVRVKDGDEITLIPPLGGG